jgi:methionyl-tRNA formyltransferase
MYYDMDLSPGVTIHYIDEGEDTGDIICQDKFDIPVGIKYADFRENALKKTGLDLLFRAIGGIADGNAERTPQPDESPTMRARNVRSEEIRNIIDWQSWDVERVWHILRGTEGWIDILKHPPGFYWTINEYKRCDMKNYEISRIYREEGSCFLACRGGKILLKLKFSFFKHGAKNG